MRARSYLCMDVHAYIYIHCLSVRFTFMGTLSRGVMFCCRFPSIKVQVAGVSEVRLRSIWTSQWSFDFVAAGNAKIWVKCSFAIWVAHRALCLIRIDRYLYGWAALHMYACKYVMHSIDVFPIPITRWLEHTKHTLSAHLHVGLAAGSSPNSMYIMLSALRDPQYVAYLPVISSAQSIGHANGASHHYRTHYCWLAHLQN